MKNIITFLILISILAIPKSISANTTVTNYRSTNNLEEILNSANRLVREKSYKAADYQFNKIFSILDSLKSTGQMSTDIERIEVLTENHYNNFLSIIEILEHSFFEDRFFLFGDIEDYKYNDNSRVTLDNNIELAGLDSFNYSKVKIKSGEKRVKKYVKYYSKRAKKSFQIFLNRSVKYIDMIKKVFKSYGLPEELAYLPILESGFKPISQSHAYAAGMWQFIKSTGKMVGLENNWWIDERKSVYKSTVGAAKLLKYLYSKYGDWNLVLAAYNVGEGGLNKRIRKHKSRNFWWLWRLPKETKSYIPKFIAMTRILKNLDKYEFKLPEKETTVYDTVHLDSCVNLKLIADLTNTNYEEIKNLNPELQQWCLPPYAKNFPILVPVEGKVNFRKEYRKIPDDDSRKFSLVNYTIIKNDNLNKIANKFKIKKEAIKDLNKFEIVKKKNKKNIKLIAGKSIKVIDPPIKEKWFTEFNNKHLTYYDDEKYFLDGRKQIKYRVRSGDSVWKIAKKFNVSRKRLKGWNKIGKKNTIFPGQRLVIYF